MVFKGTELYLNFSKVCNGLYVYISLKPLVSLIPLVNLILLRPFNILKKHSIPLKPFKYPYIPYKRINTIKLPHILLHA